MSDGDEYRFYPEDFDDDGNVSKPKTNSAPVVIVGCFGMGLGFLFASVFVDPLVVYGVQISLVVIATAMFALGLVIGGGRYIQQGRFWLGTVHLCGAIGWVFIVVGRMFSSTAAVVIGTVTLLVSFTALFVVVVSSNS